VILAVSGFGQVFSYQIAGNAVKRDIARLFALPRYLWMWHAAAFVSGSLCHDAGRELEQIQFLLGHASVQTTERYIGCLQNFREAVNDRFQISLANNAP
jgi:hypothetical protein